MWRSEEEVPNAVFAVQTGQRQVWQEQGLCCLPYLMAGHCCGCNLRQNLAFLTYFTYSHDFNWPCYGHFKHFMSLWCLVSQVRGRWVLFPWHRGRECCAEALGWREGCESVLNLGAPCNISKLALPAFIHPPFPPTTPLSPLCLRISLFILMAFAGAHLVLTPSFPWAEGWVGVAQGAGCPCPHGTAGSPGLAHLQQGRTGRRTGVPSPGWAARCAPLLPWQSMGQAARRYSCPASIQCLFSRLKGSLWSQSPLCLARPLIHSQRKPMSAAPLCLPWAIALNLKGLGADFKGCSDKGCLNSTCVNNPWKTLWITSMKFSLNLLFFFFSGRKKWKSGKGGEWEEGRERGRKGVGVALTLFSPCQLLSMPRSSLT